MLAAINRRIMATGCPETIEGHFRIAGGERCFVVARRPLRGCELDMIALKREVNALAREPGRTPPYDLGAIDAARGKDPP